jgi:hypothetical protein
MRIKHEELNRQDAKFAKEGGERRREEERGGEKNIQLIANKKYCLYKI